jgi:hypothetical protein
MLEATERLVGSAVFKTVEGSQDPWRVRFPSASAKPRHIGVFQVLPSIATRAAETFGARIDRTLDPSPRLLRGIGR